MAIKPLAQIRNSYIVAEGEEGIIIIDQHAAHERVLFEKFSRHFEEKEVSRQPLLTPIKFDLSLKEALILKENLSIFESLGFEIEEFGGESFLINAVPSELAKENCETVIKGVIDDLEQDKAPKKAQGKKEEIITYMACRSAVKFGDKLSYLEMAALLKEVDKCQNPFTCPHGRPSMFTLSFEDLEKKFGRRGLK